MKALFQSKKGRFDARLSKKYPIEYSLLVEATSFLKDDSSLKDRFYCIENGINEYPLCKGCEIKRVGLYSRFCSTKCSTPNKEVREKSKNTYMERYGVDHQSKVPHIRDKIALSNKETRSDPVKREQIKQKTLQTHIDKFGDWNSRTKSTQDKMAATNMERYGSVCPMNSPEIYKRIIENNISTIGVPIASMSDDTKEKQRITNMERYGNASPLQNKDVRKKTESTMMRRYGVVYYTQHTYSPSYKTYEYIFFDGNVIKTQGYESIAYDELQRAGYTFDEFTFNTRIAYTYNGSNRYYFPDIHIPKENRIIEVKSEYTWKADLEKNVAKLVESSKQYNVELWIIVKNKIHMFSIGDDFNVNDVVIKEEF